MEVSVIGTGYVGLVTGTCLAEIGHNVCCIDVDRTKIEMLKMEKLPIYEPGLIDLVKRNVKSKRLAFSTEFDSIKNAKVIFLAVGTPSAEDGSANLEYILEATKKVVEYVKDGAMIVIKSTVPVGTHLEIEKIVKLNTAVQVSIINNPEFLKEGSAVDDFMRPDRVIVGHSGGDEGVVMDELYAPLVRQGNPIYHMSNLSAEMTKYAANCFLATKISFINEMARLCDLCGADIEEVRKGITSDKRIGSLFLYPGPGYGGSCFPKDVRALLNFAKKFDLDLKIINAAEKANQLQKKYVFEKLFKHFRGHLKGLRFCLWGVSFKPNTDDIRESPAIEVAEQIINGGGFVHFYDPVAGENYQKHMQRHGNSIQTFENKYDAIKNCSALIVLTDWSEFKAPDFGEIKLRLTEPVLFDWRNLYNAKRVRESGLCYYSIGKRAF